MMIENHRSQLIWRLMRKCPYVRTGLRCAGFRGGWLCDILHPQITGIVKAMK